MIQPAFSGTMADAVGALDGFRLPDHIDYPILAPLGKHEVMPGHFRHGLLAVDAAVALLDAARNPRQVEWKRSAQWIWKFRRSRVASVASRMRSGSLLGSC
jgi:hypothetical protein